MYSQEVKFDIFDLSSRQETQRCRGREEERPEGGGDLMMPHPGVVRTLYLTKKDLITRSQLDPHSTFLIFSNGSASDPLKACRNINNLHPIFRLTVHNFRQVTLKHYEPIESISECSV